MKIQALLSVVCGVGLLLALNGPRMGSARHDMRHAPKTMFLFGDSFVDTGNHPRGAQGFEMTRQWYYPYGISYKKDDGSGAQANATGRFSDFMVQSDFVARMLGLTLSPPTYQSNYGQSSCAPSGMNFAFGSTGVFRISPWINIREQVDNFKTIVKSGTISKNHVSHSVALLASSGNDYKLFGGRRNSRDVAAFAEDVTTEIAANVERLRNLGVKKILVNNLHPLGCTPSLSRTHNYKVCDGMANEAAAVHNSNLKEKLGRKKGVLIVDLNTAFHSIIGHGNDLAEDTESSSFKRFKQMRKPCCESVDPKGYCGQRDENSQPLYSLCANPYKYFFWDDAHPTHAGWEAVMTQLQGPIKEFLGIV